MKWLVGNLSALLIPMVFEVKLLSGDDRLQLRLWFGVGLALAFGGCWRRLAGFARVFHIENLDLLNKPEKVKK